MSRFFLFLFLLVICDGCADRTGGAFSRPISFREQVQTTPIAVPSSRLVVLNPGDKVKAESEYGIVTITAGKGTMRTFTWQTRESSAPSISTVKLLERRGLWHGLTGIYSPGVGDDEATRVVAQEGQLRVKSIDDAVRWFDVTPDYHYVSGEDGIVMGFWIISDRAQVNFDLIQVFINEMPAKRLPLRDKGTVRIVRANAN